MTLPSNGQSSSVTVAYKSATSYQPIISSTELATKSDAFSGEVESADSRFMRNRSLISVPILVLSFRFRST